MKMKKLLLLFLLVSSVAYGQRLVGSKATIGSPTIYQALLATDIPSNFLRSNATNTFTGNTIFDANEFNLSIENAIQNTFEAADKNIFYTPNTMLFNPAGETVITWFDTQPEPGVLTLKIPGSLTSDREIMFPDADGTVALTSDITGGTWGSITGTLSNQTDLQAALNGKQTLDGDLTSIAGLATNGIPQRTAPNTWSMLSGTAGQALRMNAGATEWELYSPIANPATTDEDLIKYNGTGYDRIAVGSNGNILTVTGGVVGWAAPASISSALSALTAATGTNTINNGAHAQTWQWNTLAAASGFTLMSTSTAAASNLQTLFNVALTGANANASQTTYAMAVNNGHTGTSSTNYTGYFTASGGTNNTAVYGSASGGTNNYAGIFENGNVGIGSTAPTRKLVVNATSLSIMGFSRSGTERFFMGISDATNGLITGTAVNDFAYRTNGQQQVWSNDNGTTAHMILGATGTATLRNINVATGVSNDGGGLKHARVTTGSIGAGSTALITVTWATAFADANYTVNASVLDATTSSLSLSVVHIESISASAVTVRVLNNAVGSLTGTLHVMALHD